MRAADDRVSVERLSNLDEWEFYRLIDEESYEVVCTIGVRPSGEGRSAEYGLWRAEEAEPSLTGTVEGEGDGGPWTDATREELIRGVVYKHEGELKVMQGRLAFSLTGPSLADHDDEDEEEDSDE
jgi:hypothetical protein